MSILSLASCNSASRGYDYYQEKRVLQRNQIDQTTYRGIVAGNGDKYYDVTIDTAHPRKGTCTCPHAAGRAIICKHMVALFFAQFPEEADNYRKEVLEVIEREEMLQEEIEYRLEKTIQKMTKAQLQMALNDLLSDAADWQYERFIRTYVNLDGLDY